MLPNVKDKIYKGPNYWGRGFWIKSCRNNIVEIILTGDDVLVVEAQNRIGGRLKTTDTSQSKLGINYDLGASWFHDSLNNIVLNHMINDGLLDDEKDVYFDDKDLKTFLVLEKYLLWTRN